MLYVTKILRHGQAGQRHPHTHAGRFVHLAEHQRRLVRHAALPHLVPQVVALAAALANTGKHGIAAVLHGHIMDQLLDQHGLAHARTAEQTDLAALGIGLQQVDDLDAGLQHLGGRLLLGECRGLAVDRPALGVAGQRLLAVNGLTQHVKHPAQRRVPHGDADARTQCLHSHTSGQALAGAQQDTAHRIVADMLGHLHDSCPVLRRDRQGLLDLRQLSCREAAVDDRAGYGNDASCIHSTLTSAFCFFLMACFWAFAPEDISVISRVMAA